MPKPGDPTSSMASCKGEFSRLNIKTGQEQQYWVYPQNRYGHAARDIRYRFQRVSPFEFSPHDPKVDLPRLAVRPPHAATAA